MKVLRGIVHMATKAAVHAFVELFDQSTCGTDPWALFFILPSARRLRLQRIPVGSAERGVVGLDCFFKIKIGGEDADAGCGCSGFRQLVN